MTPIPNARDPVTIVKMSGLIRAATAAAATAPAEEGSRLQVAGQVACRTAAAGCLAALAPAVYASLATRQAADDGGQAARGAAARRGLLWDSAERLCVAAHSVREAAEPFDDACSAWECGIRIQHHMGWGRLAADVCAVTVTSHALRGARG